MEELRYFRKHGMRTLVLVAQRSLLAVRSARAGRSTTPFQPHRKRRSLLPGFLMAVLVVLGLTGAASVGASVPGGLSPGVPLGAKSGSTLPNSPDSCPVPGFTGPTNFAAGTTPWSIATGDFNQDSNVDLAIANLNSNTVSILLGNGSGGFGAATNFPVGNAPHGVAIGDFNRDGNVDLVTANNNGANVSILLGNGNGTFGAATNFPVASGSFPRAVVVADINRDGKLDVVTANGAANNISVLSGNGSGGFGAPTNYTVGTNPQSLAVGDFNRDGGPDLVVANYDSNNLTILLSSPGPAGPMQVAGTTDVPMGTNPISVAVGDFNRDGKTDLAVAYSSSASVGTALGNGDGTFILGLEWQVGQIPLSVAVGDFNRDDIQDIAAANYDSNNVSVLQGNGNGIFQGPYNFSVGTNPASVAVGDFNRDGRADLVAANANSNNVSVILNTCGATCPSPGFGTATTYSVVTGPVYVAVGDFNRDGIQDLAVTEAISNAISILLGNGTGGFGAASNYGVPGAGGQSGIAVGDFNRDGIPDLVTANYTSNNVSVLLGDGSGGIAYLNYAAGTNPYGVAVGDFNRDGIQDLAVTNHGSSNLSVLLGNGNGSFGAATNFPVGTNPFGVAVGDFNRDGIQDLAVDNGGLNGHVSVLLGNGSGGFGAPTSYAAGTGSSTVAVGDFNRDGIQDLAVANGGVSPTSITVFLGNSSGGFTRSADISIFAAFWIAIADLNGDGIQDLAVANYNSASVLLGNGLGGFGTVTDFPVDGPQSVAIGDFNRDGKADLVLPNYGPYPNNSVSVLLNSCAEPTATPTLTGTPTNTGTPTPTQVVIPGLVGYWKFDEGGGTTAVDSSGSGNNGSLVNSPAYDTSTPPACQLPSDPYSMHFFGNASGSYVNVPDSPSLHFPGQQITLSAWIKVTGSNTSQPYTIFSKGGGIGTNDTSYIFDVNPNASPSEYNKLGFFVGGNWLLSQGTIAIGQWQHVAVTYVGSTGYLNFYINGVNAGGILQAAGPILDTNDATLLGRQGSTCNCNYFQGNIDGARIYNRQLSASEISALAQCNLAFTPTSTPTITPTPTNTYTPTNTPTPAVIGGLAGHWKFNEGSGSTALDSSGNGNNGSLVNGPTYDAFVPGSCTNPPDPYSMYFYGNGSNTYVNIPDSPSLHFPANALTLSAWVAVDFSNFNQPLTIFSKGGGMSSGETSYILDVNRLGNPNNGNLSFYVNNTWYDSGVPITPNAYTHVAATYDGATVKFYLNGSLAQSIAAAGTILDRSDPTMIGRQGTTCNCNFFLGRIDETRIYNRALTAGEISALAQCNPALTPTPTSTFTRTPTYTNTPTRTPTGQSVLVGHVTWQGIVQPGAHNTGLTTTLVLCVSGSPQSYTAPTDSSGYFTMTLGLAPGQYNWQAKGVRSLANAGGMTLSPGTTSYEFGLLRSGDASNDNLANAADFNILRSQFGQSGSALAADFDNDGLVNSADFNLLRSNFGVSGSALTCP